MFLSVRMVEDYANIKFPGKIGWMFPNVMNVSGHKFLDDYIYPSTKR